jgi:hypothetical protein
MRPALSSSKAKGFEGAARQVTRSGHAVDQFIRDLKGDIHQVTLARPSDGVKQAARFRFESIRESNDTFAAGIRGAIMT